MININSEIIASDISEKAIKIAKKNADKILADNNIKFIKSDLFEDMDDYSNEDYRFDFIISNPPYIETDIISNLATDVQKEPLIALDGGKDGLKFYREINKNIKNYLKADGYLLLEIGYDQKKNVMDIFKGSECIKDYTGNDRVIIWKN
jgi:release factor glutamine methyltransferase